MSMSQAFQGSFRAAVLAGIGLACAGFSYFTATSL